MKQVNKVSVETVSEVLSRSLDDEIRNEIIQEVIRLQREKNFEEEQLKEKPKKIEWEWVTYERGDSYWTLQGDSKALEEVPEVIEKVRNDFNNSKKGRRYPIQRGQIADCFECIPQKFWKKYNVRVKSKVPTFFVSGGNNSRV